MSTTAKQDNDFLNEVIGTSALENAIEWIKSNLEVDDVFTEKDILNYASNSNPQDVFSEDDLIGWAEKNGFSKSE